MRERLATAVATLAVIAFLAWPASWKKGRDSFPLSPYPMFARKKTSPMMSLEYAVALDAMGERSFVAPSYVGSGEVLQARALISGAIRRGPDSAQQFCRELLGRLRASAAHRDTVELRLVRGRHNAVAYLQSDQSESVEKVVVSCQP